MYYYVIFHSSFHWIMYWHNMILRWSYFGNCYILWTVIMIHSLYRPIVHILELTISLWTVIMIKPPKKKVQLKNAQNPLKMIIYYLHCTCRIVFYMYGQRRLKRSLSRVFAQSKAKLEVFGGLKGTT